MNRTAMTMWWLPATRAGSVLALGMAALLAPDMALSAMTALFAAYACASGLALAAAGTLRWRADPGPGGDLLSGMFSLCAGVLALVHPPPTALVLLLLIATHALAIGILDLATARRLRQRLHGVRLLALGGAASMVFSLTVFAAPVHGAAELGIAIGLYGVVTGTLWLALALRLRAEALRRRGLLSSPSYADESAGGLRRKSI